MSFKKNKAGRERKSENKHLICYVLKKKLRSTSEYLTTALVKMISWEHTLQEIFLKYTIVLQIPAHTFKCQYLAQCFWRAITSLLPQNIFFSVLKSPSLHPSTLPAHPESRASLYCSCVSKVLDKPVLSTSFQIYFYSFAIFLLLPQSMV